MATEENSTRKVHLWTGKSQRIMLFSIIAGVIICAILFSLLGVNMTNKSRKAVDNLGDVYMENTGYHISQRFQSVINQRLSMVDSLVRFYPDYTEENKAEFQESARTRDFEFLALYRVNEEYIDDPEKGSDMLMILGNGITVTDKLPFRQSVLKGERKIAVGSGETRDENDNPVTHDNMVILSIPTNKYKMPDGSNCHALIAGLPNEDFVEMLNINNKDAKTSSAYIVRRDVHGTKTNSFVLKQEKDSDYQFLSDLFEDKLTGADVSVNVIGEELNDKMQKGEAYTKIIHINGHHVHLYSNKLANSEWYLVALMDNDQLNAIVGELGSQWITLTIVAIASLVAVLTIIFVLYSRFNKQNIEQLQKARAQALAASKAKSEFLSNMSHDIRTPMNAIVGMTAIARANIDDQQQVQNCLKKIALSSKHLLGLINDVLDMSKIESGKMTLNMEQVSLREALDSLTTIVQPQVKIKRQNFSVVVHNIEQENVYCDSVRLNQVLLNLLSNAIKFTPEEGVIEVFVEQEKSPLGDNFVRTHIRVKDNGIGMSEEYQKKIFDSFSREDNSRVHRTEGTGLGMAITKYIIDTMKGTIELQSKQGVGTQFHITLDLERAVTPEEEMILPPWNMLLVDDDQQLCETTVVALKEIGIEAEWTLDGETAIKKTLAANKTKKRYDIILLDWKLPGIDGIETAKRIRQALGDKNVPILLISSYDWSDIETEAREAGICGFISKPLFKSTLFYGLKTFVGNAENESVAASESKHQDLKGIHVLLAEDNDLNWEIAETLLDSVGITCDHAENGQICVDMFKNSKPGTYQAVLMDIRMPVMTGYEATVAIRKLDHPDKDIPIIAMTADAFADDMRRCLECGMNAHIAKPIDIDVVQKTIAKFIKK